MEKKFDWVLMVAVVLLTVIGLVVLHSINFRDPSLAEGFNPSRQLVAALLGLAALIFAARADYSMWLRIAPVWYLASLVLLVLLLIFGEVVFGATRGINLIIFDFQPTEVAKLGIIFMLSRIFTQKIKDLHRFRFLALSIVITGIVGSLILMQPDLGSVAVIGFIWLMIVTVSRVRSSHLVMVMLLFVAAMPIALAELEPYQQQRLETFFSPGEDAQGAGYNVEQSTIAVGSGQLFGRGLGGGTQSQLNFLPAQHTDFIFAVLSEKLGLMGAGLVIGLFGVVLFRGFYIAYNAKDTFGSLLATGISAMFLIQVVITIGMNLGVAPVTGLPLPFISYGGTSLVVSLFAIGILQSIAMNRKNLEFGRD